jgi:hypothetical protein
VWGRAAVLGLLFCLLQTPVDVAAGEKPTPTPSAKELWEEYPLHPTPDAASTSAPTTGRRASSPATASKTDDGTAVTPVLAGMALAIGVLALLWIYRARRIDRTAMLEPSGAPQPAATAEPTGAPKQAVPLTRGAAPQGAPPDPHQAWTAEVEWRRTQTAARFTVVARSDDAGPDLVIAESPVLDWPPTDATAVHALADAVAELEGSLLADGWTSLPAGDEWYAKRFAWTPPGAGQEPAGRFKRLSGWPQEFDQLWRCQLRWNAGNSRFEAVAYEPRESRGRTIGATPAINWLSTVDPDPPVGLYDEGLARLAAALRDAGWEQIGRGSQWYSARFVWRRPEAPGDLHDPAAAGDRRTG